jgi:hypothetical protein
MNAIWEKAYYTVGICTTAVLCVSCGGVQPTTLVPASGSTMDRASSAVRPDVQQSWMAPEAAHDNLVYVSNVETNSVSVYAFASHKMVGLLTGISQPYGLCSDTSGNVWIVGWGKNQLLEYAHAGTKRLRTLSFPDPTADLEQCSVDPTTGNLAVTNWGPDNWYQGDVLVFPDGRGQPTTYGSANIWFYYGCSYDDKGNLWVDGTDAYRNYYTALGELPKGESEFRNFWLIPSISPPFTGGVEWNAGLLAIGDWTSIIQYQPKGAFARAKTDTILTLHVPVGLFWITNVGGKEQILAPDTAGAPDAVQYWDFPAGGEPTATIKYGLKQSFGVTVSIAPK